MHTNVVVQASRTRYVFETCHSTLGSTSNGVGTITIDRKLISVIPTEVQSVPSYLAGLHGRTRASQASSAASQPGLVRGTCQLTSPRVRRHTHAYPRALLAWSWHEKVRCVPAAFPMT